MYYLYVKNATGEKFYLSGYWHGNPIYSDSEDYAQRINSFTDAVVISEDICTKTNREEIYIGEFENG